MTQSIESSDGVRVALHDLGGDGPPLLFLHATGFHGRCYQQVANHLHDDFHVWAPDLRGHGDSETPDMALPWAGACDDALAVIDHLGGGPVYGCGHSMGGATVLAAELRRPGTVRAAWLFEPIVFPGDDGEFKRRENPLAAVARKRRADFGSMDEAIESYTGRGPFADWDPAVLRDYVEHGFRPTEHGVTLKTTPENEGRTFDGIDLSVFGRLGDVSTPVTIVGSTDGFPPAQVAPVVAEHLPTARLDIWETNTHMGPFEDPARAAAEIRAAFLGGEA
ncbi:MAG: alpha/beta hydrolase [Actinomycetota bacterium]